MHRTLNLALTQPWVDRFANVVNGDDALDRTRLLVGDHNLRRVAERGVNRRVGHLRIAELLRPVDDVFGVVVDIRRAIGSQRNRTRLLHTRGSHQRAAAASGLPEAQLPRRVDDHFDARRVDAQLGDGSLQRDGVHALTHLGEAVTNLHLVVGAAETHDCGTHLAQSVAKARVLQPKSEANGLARGQCSINVRLGAIETLLSTSATVVHDLARPPDIAGMDDVALTHLPSADASLVCQAVDDALHRELRLIGTETAKRTTHRVVRAHGDALDIDVRNSIRATGVASRPLEHFHADAGV